MDPAASVAAAPTAGRGPKKQPKARKLAKDMTPDERRIESEKRAGRREAIKICQQAARLDEERRQETERYLAAQALANSKELAGKAAVHAVMLMKQEALNVAFGGAASVPPPHSVAGASSTSSVTSTLSGRPPLEPNTPGAHSPALGAHAMTGGALPVARLPPDVVRVSRACHRPQPDTVDRGHHPGMRKEASPHLYKKHRGPVRQCARAGSDAHQGGNGSSPLSIVIAGRLECQPKASHGRCTCTISWRTMVRPSCMT
jgi:hypothetical protein